MKNKKSEYVGFLDPGHVYKNKARDLAKWHYANNPDKLETTHGANSYSGITWLIRHLIDKEFTRMKNEFTNT